MREAMQSMVDKISQETPVPENEYIGESGMLHCAVCHKPTQTEVEIFGVKKIVRCICDCEKARRAEYKERERQQDIERRRKICFSQSAMRDWTFEHDDKRNPKISAAMQRYAEGFSDFKAEGTGLLLYGTVGTGKTYYAACIANYLVDADYSVLMTNFATLANKIQGTFDGKQEYIDSLNRYSLLIIDDLGAERNSEYMKETVFNIIDSRYRSGLPMIITTNLTADELKKNTDIGYSRIYDRILERCHPVAVNGYSRRRESVKENYAKMQERLGL